MEVLLVCAAVFAGLLGGLGGLGLAALVVLLGLPLSITGVVLGVILVSTHGRSRQVVGTLLGLCSLMMLMPCAWILIAVVKETMRTH
jgi:hypothetical protein